MHIEDLTAKPIRHPVWRTSLTPFCILLLTSLQKYITYSHNEQKALIVFSNDLTLILDSVELLQAVFDASHSIGECRNVPTEPLHRVTEMSSVAATSLSYYSRNPFIPISSSLLYVINTTLLSDSSPLLSKLAVHLFPNFIISCMSLKKQCEIGFWIEGSKGKIDIKASWKDCCPRCGRQVSSIQDRCCDTAASHSSLSVEMQQQLLLNWMAVASFEEKSTQFWSCARCVLLSQWLSQSKQKHWLLSKRHLPDRSDLENVFTSFD